MKRLIATALMLGNLVLWLHVLRAMFLMVYEIWGLGAAFLLGALMAVMPLVSVILTGLWSIACQFYDD